MKLVAKVKLDTDTEQFKALKQTLVTTNQACNYISEQAWKSKAFGQFRLQSAVYHSVKEGFSLTAQVIVQAVKKVIDAYKLDNKRQRKFKLLGAITYDSRILTWRTEKQFVSIWTIEGRIKVPYLCGERQKELLKSQQGETDLALINGVFYLHTTCNVENPEPGDFKNVLGVDRGIKNIATLSTGDNFASNHLLSVRCRYRRIRKKLQKKNTRSAKRILAKRKKKESRFAAHTNHVISKAIVAKAKDTKSAIILEDLKGIGGRTTVRKKQRDTHHSWGFYQLAQFIEYKAILAGVTVAYIDPRNTSRECISCGHIDKANRKSQSLFSCVKCAYVSHADLNAAMVIANRGRAALNQPYATSLMA